MTNTPKSKSEMKRMNVLQGKDIMDGLTNTPKIDTEVLKEAMREIMLVVCNGCNGTGSREVERYHGIYSTERCGICASTGRRLSDFAREFIGGRK